ncbi:discoidin domain-containing protein [Kitasatospora sp. NPDC091276]|uniref:discoidin domain-containing protein n=1 Tax=Kitasatospora sp. NPDC091276 TaxID=3155300 RepID=UPI00341DF065
MTDGNLDTYYWSARTPEFNDWIQIDLGSQRDITKIDIYLGKPDGSFTLPDCNLESSTDGTNWTHYAPVVAYQSEYHGTTARTARYMRLRMLISRSTRIAIRSFRITTKPRGRHHPRRRHLPHGQGRNRWRPRRYWQRHRAGRREAQGERRHQSGGHKRHTRSPLTPT